MRSFRIVLTIFFLGLLMAPAAKAASFNAVDLEELRSYVLSLVNRTRREEGLPIVQRHAGLEKVAQAHSADTAAHFDETSPETREQSYLAHVSSDGRSLGSRFRDGGVDTGSAFAENAGYWIREPYGETLTASKEGIRRIHEGMLAEVSPNDGHRKNLLGPYTHVGIGLSLLHPEKSEKNAVFLVTDFSLYEEATNLPPPSRSLPSHPLPTHGGPFLDVTPRDPFAEAITAMKNADIIQGYPDGTFQTKRAVNRAEFLKMALDSVHFSPIGREFTACFQDVSNQWFAPYVCVAKRKGWVMGYPDGTFQPEKTVSRAEAVTLLARILGLSSQSETDASFEDVSKEAWFRLPLESLVERNFLPFAGPFFRPELGMKRGEVAQMLYLATR